MNDLWTDIGYYSLNKHGEQLCGDHVDVVNGEDGSRIAVLADGMGSGVRASILSTLTAKIISTMMAKGLALDECVKTIAATLPAEKSGIAYSTFTILHIEENERARIIQYDNPHVIFLHNGKHVDYTESILNIEGKQIYFSQVELRCGDVLLAMSDGVVGASDNNIMNPDWQRGNVIDFMEALYHPDYSAKDLCTLLLDQCDNLYGGKPGDDVTACVVRIRKREQVNIVFGPPSRKADDRRVMTLCFSKAGRHIICGGTTAKIAAEYLNKPVKLEYESPEEGIPPISHIEGVDLVTEGVITLTRVLEYADNYVEDNRNYFKWGNKHDGASILARTLFETATDINLFVGRAVNEAQQISDGYSFGNKMHLVERLSAQLQRMGKNVKVSYF